MKLSEVENAALNCKKCRLASGRTRVVFGVGSPSANLFFIGEAPGYYEDKKGEPFVGAAGKLLDKTIKEILGLKREDIYITNVVKCRPPKNRNPQPDEIEACNPYLKKQIEIIEPEVICTLGNFATRTILNKSTGITKLRGKKYLMSETTVVPTYHPAAILRNANLLERFESDFRVLEECLEGKQVGTISSINDQPSLF